MIGFNNDFLDNKDTNENNSQKIKFILKYINDLFARANLFVQAVTSFVHFILTLRFHDDSFGCYFVIAEYHLADMHLIRIVRVNIEDKIIAEKRIHISLKLIIFDNFLSIVEFYILKQSSWLKILLNLTNVQCFINK